VRHRVPQALLALAATFNASSFPMRVALHRAGRRLAERGWGGGAAGARVEKRARWVAAAAAAT
jgi:hypothetical protein